MRTKFHGHAILGQIAYACTSACNYIRHAILPIRVSFNLSGPQDIQPPKPIWLNKLIREENIEFTHGNIFPLYILKILCIFWLKTMFMVFFYLCQK